MTKRMAALAALLVLPLVLGACSSEDTVSADDIAKAAESDASAGGSEVEVTCEDDLEAEVGASTTCEFSGTDNAGEEAEGEVLMTIEEIDGNTAAFSSEFEYAE